MNIGDTVKYVGPSTGRDSDKYGRVEGFNPYECVSVVILGGGHPFYDKPGKVESWAAAFCQVVPALPSKSQLDAEQDVYSARLSDLEYRRRNPQGAAELDSIASILAFDPASIAAKCKIVMKATEERKPIPNEVWDI